MSEERPLDALLTVIAIAYLGATAVAVLGPLLTPQVKESVQCAITKIEGFNKIVYLGKGEVTR